MQLLQLLLAAAPETDLKKVLCCTRHIGMPREVESAKLSLLVGLLHSDLDRTFHGRVFGTQQKYRRA